MQTPYLPRKIFGDDFDRVYEPAEDSFLLLDALEQDIYPLKEHARICLECGSGSGIIITALANAFKHYQKNIDNVPTIDRLLLATDLNWDACQTTKKCVNYFNQDSHVQIVRTNLAESLVDRLENSVDLLMFNPPYVPTPDEETNTEWRASMALDTALEPSLEENRLHLSWAGGERGLKLIEVFLNTYVPKLLSKPLGRAYVVVLDKNNPLRLSNFLLDEFKIRGTIVMERQAGIEHLSVVRYEWLN